MRYNANEVRFLEVLIQGKLALFCEERLEKASIPKNLYMYQVRHDEEDWTKPVEIKNYILVNFMGTLVTNEPLFSEEESCVYIDSNRDWEEISMRSGLGFGTFAAKN